jgi:hypothetical protein
MKTKERVTGFTFDWDENHRVLSKTDDKELPQHIKRRG